MVATRILLATAFCLFSYGVKAADSKMRVDTRVISAAGVVSDEASHKRKPLARKEHHQEQQEFQPSFSDLAKVTQLGTDLKIAYEAIIAAVELFKAGSYTEGTDAVIDAAVTFLEKYSPETAAKFTENVARLQTSVARAQSISTELQNFKSTGDSQALASALQDILKEVEAVAVDAGNEKAVQVIQGFEIVINGTAEYWGSIKNAEDPAAAIEDLYDALKESAILIIGEENSDKLDTLFVALDATIGDLTSIVESYKRELEEKELCLKIYKPKTSRPDACPEGTTVKAGKCMASASASALEGEFWGKVKTWFQSSKPQCASGLEACGRRCRAPFPAGCTPVRGCACQISQCPTTHPVDVKVPFVNFPVGVCAKDDGSVEAWGQELWAALGAVKAKFDTRPPQTDHAHLTSTIEAGLEAGKQLIVPSCSKLEQA